MNENKRADYKGRFLRLVDVSESELDDKLPGRRKYCSKCLQPLPFEGISVIHNVSREDARAYGLAGMIDSVIAGMNHAGLKGKVAFVSTDSLHATTFDLINEVKHAQQLDDAGFFYKQVRADIEETALAFLDSCAPVSGTITIAGLGMFCPRVLKLDLSISRDVLEMFQDFRLKLHGRLCDEVAGYPTVRAREWNCELSGHITFGYFVNPLQAREIDALLDFIEEFNQQFRPISFELTQGEVTRFTDMDHYEAVEH